MGIHFLWISQLLAKLWSPIWRTLQ